MNAFEDNKYNSTDAINSILAEATIVSYGYISAIDFDSVIVTQTVSDIGTGEKIRCKFMVLGDDVFALQRTPSTGMRVAVFSANKSADGMFDTAEQLESDEGQGFIVTGSPANYSAQYAFCFPVRQYDEGADNTIEIEDDIIAIDFDSEVIAALNGDVDIDFNSNTNIEFHEGTENFIGHYGNLEEAYGYTQGVDGAEKEGPFTRKITHGKNCSVEQSYEKGFDLKVGKAFPTPFADDPGTEEDVEGAPVTGTFGANSPMTLTFGDNVITISIDPASGFSVALTGSASVNLTAATGKLKIGNDMGSLKDVLEQIIDAVASLTTEGGATAQAASAATQALCNTTIKPLVGNILE